MAVALTPPDTTYRGRFAPSPTGPLHLGSLLTAVASYVDARAAGGEWLIRIEDLDPPREQAGASQQILETLRHHGMESDQPVMFQSQRHRRYRQVLQQLLNQDLAFYCDCSRQQIQQQGGIYLGNCRRSTPLRRENCAVRLKASQLPPPLDTLSTLITYADLLQGHQQQQVDTDVGDFVIFRKDGLFAYQLAVVVDDIDQAISHVIRGADLLDNTPRQLWLYQLLGATPPQFGHLPVITNSHGQKLSKQTFAAAVDDSCASDNLCQVLALLNHTPPDHLRKSAPQALLAWASSHWSRARLPKGLSLPQPAIASPPSF